MSASQIARLLGEEPARRRGGGERLALIELGEKGVTKAGLMRLADQLALTTGQLAEMLPVSGRTIQRYRRTARFNRVVSEQILQLAEVLVRGKEVFGDRDRFLAWLRAPSTALGNRIPVSLLASRFGVELVLDEIGRLEHGVHS